MIEPSTPAGRKCFVCFCPLQDWSLRSHCSMLATAQVLTRVSFALLLLSWSQQFPSEITRLAEFKEENVSLARWTVTTLLFFFAGHPSCIMPVPEGESYGSCLLPSPLLLSFSCSNSWNKHLTHVTVSLVMCGKREVPFESLGPGRDCILPGTSWFPFGFSVSLMQESRNKFIRKCKDNFIRIWEKRHRADKL